MPLNISSKAIDMIHQHALETFPEECCGFMYGVETEIRTITECIPVINSMVGDKKRRFEISPLDYLKGEHYATKNDKTLLGIYHSHPLHPAKPSEHDRKQAVDFFSYIITSVDEDEIKNTTSWRLNEKKQFDNEQIKVFN